MLLVFGGSTVSNNKRGVSGGSRLESEPQHWGLPVALAEQKAGFELFMHPLGSEWGLLGRRNALLLRQCSILTSVGF